jgi:hypothetical protein
LKEPHDAKLAKFQPDIFERYDPTRGSSPRSKQES